MDAGTGVKSLEWILTLPTERWTAITAAHRMADNARAAVGSGVRPQDRLLVGNWINDSLLTGETFDTVLVDYLVGAIEGFAPYWQDRVFERLRPLVAEHGRLYLIGLEPYVQFEPESPAGKIIWEIGRVRDACLLLAGERPYRSIRSIGRCDSWAGPDFGWWKAAAFPSATARDTSIASWTCARTASPVSRHENWARRCTVTSTVSVRGHLPSTSARIA